MAKLVSMNQNNGFPTNGGVRIRENFIVSINKLILGETSTYKKQFVRPITTQTTMRDLSVIKDAVSRRVEGDIKTGGIEAEIIKNSPQLMTPSERIIAEAPIANGWDTKRFKFALEIEYKVPNSNISYIEYVQGYTNYFGYVQKGSEGILDEKMLFIPNSILSVKKTFNKRLQSYVPTILGNFKITFDETGVFNHLKVAKPDAVIEKIKQTKSIDLGIQHISNIPSFNDITLIEKDINIPILYVAKLIKKTMETMDLVDDVGYDEDIYLDILSNVIGNEFDKVKLFKHIKNLKEAVSDPRRLFMFSIEDLKRLDPSVPAKTTVTLASGPQQIAIYNINDSADTHDTSYETRAAYLIQETISDIMSKTFLGQVAFSATNISGELIITPNTLNPVITGMNPIPLFEKFKTLFTNLVWPTISHNDELQIELNVMSILEGDTIVGISVDGGSEVVYKFPTFANAKFNHLVMDEGNLNRLTSDYQNMLDVVITEASEAKQRTYGLITNPNALHMDNIF